MVGHGKWSNIKHRKGAQDAKRGKVFTKIIRELTVAARIGGADTSVNSRLRTSVRVMFTLTEAETMFELIVMLGNLDDVQNVYSSAEIPENVLVQLEL